MDGSNQKGIPGSVLGPLFDIVLTDIFLFIENCTLYNYTHDNSMIYPLTTIQNGLSNLRFGCKIATDWFDENDIKAKRIPFDDFVIKCHRWHRIEIGQEYHS